jgi:hypothetical protein
MTATISDLLESGACVGQPVDLFFLPRGKPPPGRRDGRQVCAVCPVRVACLEQQMVFEGDLERSARAGVWGGLLPQQRYDLYVKRRGL